MEVDVFVLCIVNFYSGKFWTILGIIYPGGHAAIDAYGLKGGNIII